MTDEEAMKLMPGDRVCTEMETGEVYCEVVSVEDLGIIGYNTKPYIQITLRKRQGVRSFKRHAGDVELLPWQPSVPRNGLMLMPTPEPETCFNCRFWENENGGTNENSPCKRYAPRVMLFQIDPDGCGLENADSGAWPRTLPGDWCGEWKPK